MKMKGGTKGSEFLTLAHYVRERYGEEGLKLLEQRMAELGYPLSFKEIRPAHWYLEAHNVLAILVAKEIFGWKDLFEFGYHSPLFSFGVKVFIRFLPLSLFASQVPKIWRKFLDVGNLYISKIDEKEKFLIIRLENYLFHPEMCLYYAGFFLRIGEFVIKGKNFTIKEISCPYRGGDAHEYLVKWE